MNIIKLRSPDFFIGKVLLTIRALMQLGLFAIKRPSWSLLRFSRLVLRITPRFTMLPPSRLENLCDVVRRSNELGLEGDIVQCGVWHGGSAALMGHIDHATSNGTRRQIWMYDSFEGMPRPTANDGEKERKAYFEGWDKGDPLRVRKAFEAFGLSVDDHQVVPGWFAQTFSDAYNGPIAVLHVDADWYDSVKAVLDRFYDQVVPGGFVVLDDFHKWPGCSHAVADFSNERGVEFDILRVDNNAAYFVKADQ